jgi:hypothetical protein
VLTTLVVEGQPYYPLSLLAMLQQAWPSVAKPAGDGTLATPWQPKKPAEWYYCSKQKPGLLMQTNPSFETKSTTTQSKRITPRFWVDSTNMAWVIVGGRLISINTTNYYASDHGEAPSLKSGSTGLTYVPDMVYDKTTYSNIYRQLAYDYQSIKDKSVAQKIRSLLNGGALGQDSDILPVLTAVWFISEPARNHTAFHTGLMLLDLIEQGIKIGTGDSFAYTMQNALWNTGMIEAVGADSARTGMSEDSPTGIARYQTTATVREQTGYYKRGRPIYQNKNVVTDRGVELTGGTESALPGGIASMAHDHSAHGGAYDLTGAGEYKGAQGENRVYTPADGMHSTALTIVRRKEATILIRWLSCALKKKFNLTATVGSGGVRYPNVAVAAAYSEVEGMVGKEANKILQLCQERVQSFDLMIDGPEAKATPVIAKLVVQLPVQREEVKAVNPNTTQQTVNSNTTQQTVNPKTTQQTTQPTTRSWSNIAKGKVG